MKRSIKSLVRMTGSRSYETRMEALEALSDSQLDIEPLIRKAIGDRDDLVRTTAAEIAGGHNIVSLSDELIRCVKSDRSALVRSAAAVALGELGAVQGRDVLTQRMARASKEELVAIQYALIKLGRPKYLGSLLKALSHTFYRVRYAAAHLLPGVVNPGNIRLVRDGVKQALEREGTVLVRSSLKEALEEIDSTPEKGSPLTP